MTEPLGGASKQESPTQTEEQEVPLPSEGNKTSDACRTAFEALKATKIEDRSLEKLRDGISDVLLPLLVRVFEARLALEGCPFSEGADVERIVKELKSNRKDLSHLIGFCESAIGHIDRALQPVDPQAVKETAHLKQVVEDHLN